MNRHILPNAMLGILGGGQLGRMFTLSAKAMGYRVTVLDPDPDSPAGSLADVHLQAAYDDPAALQTLAETCAAVTTEFENVPADSMRFLERHIRVSPSAECVAIAQDRIREKRFVREAGLQTAPFLAVEIESDMDGDLSEFLPGILKISRLGYDGKGQVHVADAQAAKAAFRQMGGKPCVLEKALDLKLELSVVVTRIESGEAVCFPAAENQHESGILDVSIVPARVSADVSERARRKTLALAEKLDYIGVLAVEFFLLKDDDLVVNEIAPRPHNSGHYTLDATLFSQFDQQVRSMCGLPPGGTRLLSPAVMVNLLGDIWREDEPAWDKLLSEPNVHLHLYGKKSARIGRKMGHYNVLASNPDAALAQALALKQELLKP
ncbi:MAG: 5-(carboxyamino)imidazole ribonucleotide synthase [Methylococcaceae bacterium]|nr:5-(carboxyamino)imidazole ribonucleotide synthase [Methylococcaceae bacterium]